VGRKSGKVYRTPVNVFRAPNGFTIALTYSSQCEWVKNVLAAGRCELKTRGHPYELSAPNVVCDPTRRRIPCPTRGNLAWERWALVPVRLVSIC
jgi:deazaflavin-dependent oxidoreductase (nitroreductase family)